MVEIAELKGLKLGQVLIKMGKVTKEQVAEALDLQQQHKIPIGRLLVEQGYVTDVDVNSALAAQAGMASLNLDELELKEELIGLLPPETAQAYRCLPLAYDKPTKTLTVAFRNDGSDNFRSVDDLQLLMGYKVKAVVADAAQVDKYVAKFYGHEESIADLYGAFEQDAELLGEGGGNDLDKAIAMADDNKVKRLLNLVLMQAIKDKASDIHFEPFEGEFKMRYRVDGVLYEMIPPPPQLALAIISRIKVMSNLDIAERRLPQDGRIELLVNNKPVDLRVATCPTVHGETVVMRVLDRTNTKLDLEKIGLREDDLGVIKQLISKPNGIVIVTGPTGSGKTTTLYSVLNYLNDPETKLLTAEDPVEYDIDGLVQVQINEDVGMTFARALRSFLRLDPDIILVGETRDIETAQIAVQASLTGHLVFTTLHTNDAPSSVARLLDLGLEPFLVTATLEGIIAQRLVRKICINCKEAFSPTDEQLMELELHQEDVAGRVIYRGKGCDLCNHSGYKGRMALFEIMVVDDSLRELIMDAASTQVLRAACKKRGMRTLRQSGLLGIFDGITTIDEVVRETLGEED